MRHTSTSRKVFVVCNTIFLVTMVVLALVLFGGGKLAGVGKALGKSIKDFKNEVKDDKAEEKSKEDKKDET